MLDSLFFVSYFEEFLCSLWNCIGPSAVLNAVGEAFPPTFSLLPSEVFLLAFFSKHCKTLNFLACFSKLITWHKSCHVRYNRRFCTHWSVSALCLSDASTVKRLHSHIWRIIAQHSSLGSIVVLLGRFGVVLGNKSSFTISLNTLKTIIISPSFFLA